MDNQHDDGTRTRVHMVDDNLPQFVDSLPFAGNLCVDGLPFVGNLCVDSLPFVGTLFVDGLPFVGTLFVDALPFVDSPFVAPVVLGILQEIAFLSLYRLLKSLLIMYVHFWNKFRFLPINKRIHKKGLSPLEKAVSLYSFSS
jgi:hypothetical protein